MRHIFVLASAALVVIATSPARASDATGTVIGRVVESSTARPLRDATVAIDGTTRFTMTSKEGTFAISAVHVGTHKLTIRAKGFRGVEVRGIWVTRAGTSYIPFVALRQPPSDMCPGEVDVIEAGDSLYVARMLQLNVVPRLASLRTPDLIPLPTRRCAEGIVIYPDPHDCVVIRGAPISWGLVREERAMNARNERAAAMSSATKRPNAE